MREEVSARLRTLPRKLKVGAYDYRTEIHAGKNPEDDYGTVSFEDFKINLWPEAMPSSEFLVGVVLHELLHIIYENIGLAGLDEEKTVTGFEVGLVALYRDNPKLLTWIKKGLK